MSEQADTGYVNYTFSKSYTVLSQNNSLKGILNFSQ